MYIPPFDGDSGADPAMLDVPVQQGSGVSTDHGVQLEIPSTPQVEYEMDPLEVKRLQEKGKIGFLERWFRKTPEESGEALPFIGTGVTIAKYSGLRDAMTRLTEDKYDGDTQKEYNDTQAVKQYFNTQAEERIRGLSFGAEVGDAVFGSFGLAIELGLSFGLSKFATGMAKKGIKVSFKEAAEVYAKSGKMAKLGVVAASGVPGALPHAAAGYKERRVAQGFRYFPNEGVLKILKEGAEKPYTSMYKATMGALTEYYTEFAGGGFITGAGAVTKMAANKIFGKRLAYIATMGYAKKLSGKLGRLVPFQEAASWLAKNTAAHSVPGEMDEELLGQVIRAAGGWNQLDPLNGGEPDPARAGDRLMAAIPDLRDLGVMATSFSLAAIGMRGMVTGYNAVRKGREIRDVPQSEIEISDEEFEELAKTSTIPTLSSASNVSGNSRADVGVEALNEIQNEKPASSGPELVAKISQRSESNLANPARIAHNRERLKILNQNEKTLVAKLEAESHPEERAAKSQEALDAVQAQRAELAKEIEGVAKDIKERKEANASWPDNQVVGYQVERLARLRSEYRKLGAKAGVHQAEIRAVKSGELTARAQNTQRQLDEIQRQKTILEEEIQQLFLHPDLNATDIGEMNVDVQAVKDLETVKAEFAKVEEAVNAGDGTQTLRLQELLVAEAQLEKKIKASKAAGKIKVQMTFKEVQKLERQMLTDALKAMADGYELGSRESLKEAKRLQGVLLRVIEDSGLGKETKGRFARRIMAIQTGVQAEKFLPKLLADVDQILAGRELKRARDAFKKMARKAKKFTAASEIGTKTKGELIAALEPFTPEAIEEMSAEELHQAAQDFSDLATGGKTAHGLEKEAWEIKQNKDAETLVAESRASHPNTFENPELGLVKGTLEATYNHLRKLTDGITSWATYTKLLDRVKKVGAWRKLMAFPVSQQYTAWLELNRKWTKQVSGLIEKYVGDTESKWLGGKQTFKNVIEEKEIVLPGVAGKTTMKWTQDVTMTGRQLLAVYVNSKMEENRKALTSPAGNALSEQTIEAITAAIPENMRKLMDEIQVLLHDVGLQARAVTGKITGDWMKLGEPGTYWPKVRDELLSARDVKTDSESLFRDQKLVVDMRPGATQARTKAEYGLDLKDPFVTLEHHFSEMSKYITMGEVIRDKLDLLERKEVKAEIVRALGSEGYEHMRESLVTIAKGPQRAQSSKDAFGRKLLSNTSTMFVQACGVNMTAIMNLVTGPFNAIQALGQLGNGGAIGGSWALGRGALAMLSPTKDSFFPIVGMMKWVDEIAPEMKQRFENQKNAHLGLLEGSGQDAFKKFKDKHGLPAKFVETMTFGAFRLFDACVAYPAFMGAYQQATGDRVSGDKMIDKEPTLYASDIVESSQGTKRLDQLGRFFTHDLFWKGVTQLFGYSAGSLQLSQVSISNAKAKAELEGIFSKEFIATAGGAAFGLLMLQIVAPAFMSMLAKVPWEDLEDEETRNQKFVEFMLLEAFNKVPAIGNYLGKWVANTIYGEGNRPPVPSLYEPLELILDQVAQLKDGEIGERGAAALALLSLASRRLTSLGAGSPAFFRFMEGAYNWDGFSVHDVLALFLNENTISPE